MFEQTNRYTITADERQWILIWHPKGPKYQEDKGTGKERPLPLGDRFYFLSLKALANNIVERQARLCDNFQGILDILERLESEVRAINALERLKK